MNNLHGIRFHLSYVLVFFSCMSQASCGLYALHHCDKTIYWFYEWLAHPSVCTAPELFQSPLLVSGTDCLNVTSAPSVAVFRSRLKTHLFDILYPDPVWLYSACAVTLIASDTIIVLVTYLLYTMLTAYFRHLRSFVLRRTRENTEAEVHKSNATWSQEAGECCSICH